MTDALSDNDIERLATALAGKKTEKPSMDKLLRGTLEHRRKGREGKLTFTKPKPAEESND